MTSRVFQSLPGRLLIVLLGLTALPALLIGGLAYRNARQTVEARVIAQLTSIADLKKEQIAAWLDDRTADARLIADNFLNAASHSSKRPSSHASHSCQLSTGLARRWACSMSICAMRA